jgi:hypothetical protein
VASLISWLAYSGARTSTGAVVASGKAWFFQPGTTDTQVTVFSDADGLYPQDQPVSLDAAGRAVVYTDQVVQCEVQTAAGVTVRLSDRANAVQAAQVEIQNDGATGTDLTTGAQVAGGRTDLDTFISNLYTSFGAPDGQVLVGGVATNLSDVVGGNLYNVQQFGALGNDIADDTAAYQRAHDQIEDAGGGILLVPPGTYKITAVLNWSSAVRIMGAGPDVCIIKQYTAATAIFGSTTGLSFSGVKFTANTSTTATFVQVIAAATAVSSFSHCAFVGNNQLGSLKLSGAATLTGCYLVDTKIFAGTSGGQADVVTLNGGRVEITDAALVIAGMNHVYSGGALVYNGVGVVSTSPDTDSYQFVTTASDGFIFYNACRFFDNTTDTITLVPFASGGFSGTGKAYESGCHLGTGWQILGNASGEELPAISTWRDHAYKRTSTSSITYAPDSSYKFHEVVSSGATFEWSTPIAVPAAAGISAELVLRYKNTSGGAVTPTFSAAYKMSAVSVANNSAQGWHLVYDNSLACWVQISTTVAYAS